MKNRTKFVGIIALVALVGFFFVSCEGDRGARGPMGLIATETLTLFNMGATELADTTTSVPTRDGTAWNPGRDTSPNSVQGTLVNETANYGFWAGNLTLAERLLGVRNFQSNFTITNDSAYDISVRIFLDNPYDFMIGTPFVTERRDTNRIPRPDETEVASGLVSLRWIEAGSSYSFAVMANVGTVAADGTITTPIAQAPHTQWRNWMPLALMNNPVFIAVENDANAPLSTTTGVREWIDDRGPAARTTDVIVEVDRAFAPWVQFQNEETRITFTVNVTLTPYPAP